MDTDTLALPPRHMTHAQRLAFIKERHSALMTGRGLGRRRVNPRANPLLAVALMAVAIPSPGARAWDHREDSDTGAEDGDALRGFPTLGGTPSDLSPLMAAVVHAAARGTTSVCEKHLGAYEDGILSPAERRQLADDLAARRRVAWLQRATSGTPLLLPAPRD